jgi:hypothetical protein
MLFLEDKRFYVYIYLNPLKPGNYNYLCGNVKLHFDFSPFYVGEGRKNRLYDHLKEAKKIIEEEIKNNKKQNSGHKLNTIKKILRNNLKPIIFKLEENLSINQANNREKFYIGLIGRKNIRTGSLTNLTDGGEGTSNLSEETIRKRTEKFKKTLEEHPEIKINSEIKRLKTRSISTDWLEKSNLTLSKTLKNNPEIIKNRIKTYKNTLKNNPEININKGKKISKIVIENKNNVGRKNPNYKKINYEFLIKEYFKIQQQKDIIYNYNLNHSHSISKMIYYSFLQILNFPFSNLKRKNLKKIYLSFIEQNKHKMQWYINNYEKLEKEHFDKKNYEKYGF